MRGVKVKTLIKLALIVGAITLAAKIVAAKKSEWQGLTEAEVRDKLHSRLPDRIPDDKRTAAADLLVSKMRERGLLRAEQEPAATADRPDPGPGSSDTAADSSQQ